MTSRFALTRPNMSSLEVQNGPGGYRVVGTPVFSRLRMEPIYAPRVRWVRGEHVLDKQESNGDYRFDVLVMGNTAAELDARLDVLEDAVWQFDFVAQWEVFGGHKEAWLCQIGNIENLGGEDGGKDELRLIQHKSTVRVTGRHLGPVAVS